MEISPIAETRQALAADLQRLNSCMTRALQSPNTLLNSVVAHYLQQRGKQIRPISVMLAAQLVGGDASAPAVLHAAMAVELLHNASLIHDDVVDETDTRRAQAAINALWGNHMAVLVGDFFLANALTAAAQTRSLPVMEAIGNLGRLLSIGEVDEIYNAHYNDLDEEAYYRIIERKTASLFVTCFEVGALAAGATPEQVEALRQFGLFFGLCFQIRDDIFDYFPRPDALGKPTGNDLREGKVTLPLLHVLADATRPDHDELTALARLQPLEAPHIERLTAAAVDGGGIDYAYTAMEGLRARGARALCRAFAPSQTRSRLLSLLDYIIERRH